LKFFKLENYRPSGPINAMNSKGEHGFHHTKVHHNQFYGKQKANQILHSIMRESSWSWWYTTIIPALGEGKARES
jgi:hypothetical protein